jgi:hypothetical protein
MLRPVYCRRVGRWIAAGGNLVATGACWNPDFARLGLETSKVRTPEGVQQWWVMLCERDDSNWSCDPPEFKQSILVTLPVCNETHRVELSFDTLTSLERARALAERALAIYADPTSRVPTCSSEDVELEDVYRDFEFPAETEDQAKQQAPCWLDVIVVA